MRSKYFVIILLVIAGFSILTSCKKNDSAKPVHKPMAIDTLSVFTGNKWLLYQYGSAYNHNYNIDSLTISLNTYQDIVTYESTGMYFDTIAWIHSSTKGYWYFIGTSKSVFKSAKDTIHTPLDIDFWKIYSITDSTLVMVDSPSYFWKFFRKT